MKLAPFGSRARIDADLGRVVAGGFLAPLAAAAAIGGVMSGGYRLIETVALTMVFAIPLGFLCVPVSMVVCALLAPRLVPRLIYACVAGALLGPLPIMLLAGSSSSISEPPLALLRELTVFFIAPGALGGAAFWLIVVPGAKLTHPNPPPRTPRSPG